MNRRSYLAIVSSGTVAGLAGCSGSDLSLRGDDADGNDSAGSDSDTTQLPADCPVSQGLGVSFPDRVEGDAVRAFIGEYEPAYVERQAEAERDTTKWTISALSTSVIDVEESSPGFVVETRTVWSERTKLDVTIVAEPQDGVPDGVEPVAADALPDEAELAANVARAAVSDGGEVDRRDEDQNYNLLTAPLESSRSDAGEYYVTVEDAPVSLDVTSGYETVVDANETAWYYVDDGVVRRTADEGADPEDGELLECPLED